MKRRILKLSIIALVSLALCLGMLGIKALISSKYASQRMAERWQGGSVNYAQLTWFLPQSDGYTTDSVTSWRRSIDSAFANEAITSENEDARLWIDCYSGEGTVYLSNSSNSVSARAIVTGGDFFAFHPLSMLYGWYYYDDDVMDDAVILDKNLAWQLFGGYDLQGMSIEINGRYCLVAGVCDLPNTKAELDSYTDEPTVYLSASLMERIAGDISITCYEVAVPDPVSGFAEEKVGKALAFPDGRYEFVENSDRFSNISSLEVISQFGKRSQRITAVYFPWWENAARYIESWCALLVLAASVFAVYPVVYVLGMCGGAIVKRKSIYETVSKTISKRKTIEENSENREEDR